MKGEMMNKILSKVGEGLIVGVMVAIVGSLTGILWSEYHGATEELNNARELLEKQITGTNEVQAKINNNIKEYIASSQKFKNETILKFIKQQNDTNLNIQKALNGLQEVAVANMKEALETSGTRPGEITPPSLPKTGAVSLPKFKPVKFIARIPVRIPTVTELDRDKKRLEQLETFQVEQRVLQQEQMQIQQQIKR